MKFLAVIAVATLACRAAEIGVAREGGKYVVRVRSADGELTVSVDAPDAPAMLGTTAVEAGFTVFRPRFPLQPGVRYRASWKAGAAPPNVKLFDVPRDPAGAVAFVESVYPSANKLPENQLKFYFHFSAPMSRGEAYKNIRLMDDMSRAVELPFLELDEELWDRDGKRLTLFFDPGRIKRGLVPHNEAGVPLQAGHAYTLVIDAKWRDATGAPMAKSFEKRFTVAEADRTAPELRNWRVMPPSAGSVAALAVELGEAMDFALLHRMIAVEDAAGKAVGGAIAVDREESRWRFTPDAAWKAGKYRLAVDTALEDLAGNKIGKLFDVDVFTRVDKSLRPKVAHLPFAVR